MGGSVVHILGGTVCFYIDERHRVGAWVSERVRQLCEELEVDLNFMDTEVLYAR